MERFKNQVAVVIGGAGGIGWAITERLAREGAKVSVFDISLVELNHWTKDKGDIHSFIVDIISETDLKDAVQKVIALHGRLDIVINSAGIVGPTSTKIDHYELKLFQKVLELNLTGAFNITKAVLPHMLERNYGRILHITSIGGKEGNPGMVGYAASKAGLIGLIKGVGKEYANTGITINGIAPAVIATQMNLETSPEMLKYMIDKIPMGRLGTPEEVAALACWIVSEEATFNTGFIFDLSGGRATY